MTTDELDSVDPGTALEMYLQSRQSELAESTLNAHRRRLKLFTEWADEQGIDALKDLTPRDLHEYRVWRQQGIKTDNLSPETLRSALLTLRVYLRFAGSIDAADPELSERVILPTSAKRSRDEKLESDHAERLLSHLSRYEYASHAHVIIRLLWEIGIRAGTMRTLDLRDYSESNQSLRIRHRPDTDTPLKNATAANRHVAIKPETSRILDDYIVNNRPDTEDRHGRKPLLATGHGRRSMQSIRATVYYWTCPCRINDACPHDRDPDVCEANNWEDASKCPSSVSPHPVRRGAITHHLREGVPVSVVSDRSDVSPSVLDEHYDRLSETESMEVRRGYLDNI